MLYVCWQVFLLNIFFLKSYYDHLLSVYLFFCVWRKWHNSWGLHSSQLLLIGVFLLPKYSFRAKKRKLTLMTNMGNDGTGVKLNRKPLVLVTVEVVHVCCWTLVYDLESTLFFLKHYWVNTHHSCNKFSQVWQVDSCMFDYT